MSVDNPAGSAAPAASEPAAAARRLMRTALKGVTGHARSRPAAIPIRLSGAGRHRARRHAGVADLAPGPAHAAISAADQRASLLIDGTARSRAIPLTGGRVTADRRTCGRRPARRPARGFSRATPSAEAYAELSRFCACTPSRSPAGHYIGGFGTDRRSCAGRPHRPASRDAPELTAAEADIVEPHEQRPCRCRGSVCDRTCRLRRRASWRMCGIDPDGCDLLHRSNAARIDFPSRCDAQRSAHGPGRTREAGARALRQLPRQ